MRSINFDHVYKNDRGNKASLSPFDLKTALSSVFGVFDRLIPCLLHCSLSPVALSSAHTQPACINIMLH